MFEEFQAVGTEQEKGLLSEFTVISGISERCECCWWRSTEVQPLYRTVIMTTSVIHLIASNQCINVVSASSNNSVRFPTENFSVPAILLLLALYRTL